MTDLTPHEKARLRRVMGALADTAPTAPDLEPVGGELRRRPGLVWAAAAFAVTIGVLGIAILLTGGEDGSSVVATTTTTVAPPTTTPTTTSPTTTTTIPPDDATTDETTVTTVVVPDLPRGVEVDLGFNFDGPASALYAGFGVDLWLSVGGGEGAPDAVPEVYRIDPGNQSVMQNVEIGQSAFLMDGSQDSIWMVKWGDGAAPDTLVSRYNFGTAAVEQTNLGMEFSPAGIVSVGGGLWMVQGNGWPPEIAFFDVHTEELTFRYAIDGTTPHGITFADGAVWTGEPNLWVADFDGTVRQYVPETGELVSVTVVSGQPTAIGRSSRDIWVMGVDGSLWVLDRDGAIVGEWEAPQPDGRACCLLVGPGSDAAWFAYDSGEIYHVTRDVPPTFSLEAGQDFVTAIAQSGTGFWTAGETLTRIELGQ